MNNEYYPPQVSDDDYGEVKDGNPYPRHSQAWKDWYFEQGRLKDIEKIKAEIKEISQTHRLSCY